MKSLNTPSASIFEKKHYPPNHIFGPHAHKQFELNFVSKGNCSLYFDDETLHFKKDDIMIILPNQRHEFRTHLYEAELVQLEFDPEVLPELTHSEFGKYQLFSEKIQSYYRHCIKISRHTKIIGLIQKSVHELNNPQIHTNTLVRLYYLEIFILLNRYIQSCFLETKSHSNVIIQKAKTIIHNHFNDTCLISKIADELSITPRYLRAVFQDKIGMSPKKYISRVRIKIAMQFLANETLSVKEISSICGFSSTHYFQHFFKHSTGQTPIEFRNTTSENRTDFTE